MTKINKNTRYKVLLNALNSHLQQIESYVYGWELKEDVNKAKEEMKDEWNMSLATLRHYEKLSCLSLPMREGDQYWK